MNSVENTIKLSDDSSRTNNILIKTTERVESNNVLFSKSNYLFRFDTTRKEDSYILDIIHGNSFLFGDCRKVVLDDDCSCYFCGSIEDSAHHQLIECKELAGITHKDLLTKLCSPENALAEVLVPTVLGIQRQFIIRCRFLKEQHDMLEYDELNASDDD